MDTLKIMAISGVTAIVLVVALMVSGAFKSETLGGVPGINILPSTLTPYSGTVMSTTTVGTGSTLDQAELASASVVRVTPGGGAGVTNVTVSIGASTTFPGINNPGDHRRFVIENAATVATTTTIAAGTGIDLQEPDGQNVVIGQNNYAFVWCFREASTDIVCNVDETIPAD